jgi:hypothetical protein
LHFSSLSGIVFLAVNEKAAPCGAVLLNCRKQAASFSSSSLPPPLKTLNLAVLGGSYSDDDDDYAILCRHLHNNFLGFVHHRIPVKEHGHFAVSIGRRFPFRLGV